VSFANELMRMRSGLCCVLVILSLFEKYHSTDSTPVRPHPAMQISFLHDVAADPVDCTLAGVSKLLFFPPSTKHKKFFATTSGKIPVIWKKPRETLFLL